MGKIKKAVVSLIVISSLLTGCTNVSDRDAAKDYKEILDATLGDWTIIKKETEVEEDDYLPVTYVSDRWDISYKNKHGEEKSLYFYNDGTLTDYLDGHLNDVFNEEFKKVYSDAPFIGLTDPHVNESDRHIYQREQSREFKEIYNFQNFSFDKVFTDSGIYIYITVESPNSEEQTEEDRLNLVAEMKEWEQKIIKLIPNVNLVTFVTFRHKDHMSPVENFYINGKVVHPKAKRASGDTDGMYHAKKVSVYAETLVDMTK